METIYAIIHRTKPLAYIGRTTRTLEERFAEHVGTINGPGMKTLTEHLRSDLASFECIECEVSETASEAAWMGRFEADGYTLLNDTGGNAKPPKRREVRVINERPVPYDAARSAEVMAEIRAEFQKYEHEPLKHIPWKAGVGYEQDVLDSIRNTGRWSP